MARLAWIRRQAIKDIIPPRKCSGTAQGTGERCERYAVVGSMVCYKHGAAAPQVKAAAEERVSLAEALASGDRRPPWVVMEDTLHIADVLMQQVLMDVRSTGTASPQVLDKLVSAIERANRLSKTVLDAGVAERRTRIAEAQATQIYAILTRTLNALDLTTEQRARVPALLRREIEGELVEQTSRIAA